MITQAQSEVKYDDFVILTCTTTVDPKSVLGPIKWVGCKLVDQSPTPISNKTDGVIITKSEKQSTSVLKFECY